MTFAAAVLCVPLMRVLVGLHERAPWQFLGLRRVAARDVATACAAAAIFIAIADPINIWVFERPLVPPFMRAAYASSRSPVILFLAIVVVAPLFEELLFRGFLFGVLRARGVPAAWTVAIVTLLFTIIHTQYRPARHGAAAGARPGIRSGPRAVRFDRAVDRHARPDECRGIRSDGVRHAGLNGGAGSEQRVEHLQDGGQGSPQTHRGPQAHVVSVMDTTGTLRTMPGQSFRQRFNRWASGRGIRHGRRNHGIEDVGIEMDVQRPGPEIESRE